MTHLFVRHKVADFTEWKKVFDSHAEAQKEAYFAAGDRITMRRVEKEIKDIADIAFILEKAKYITIAMCLDGEPYLVSLSHGYDRPRHRLYFHCTKEGKKIDYLKDNNRVWGQALLDKGYVQGACDHMYATVHFKGRVTFVEDVKEKRHALEVMIRPWTIIQPR